MIFYQAVCRTHNFASHLFKTRFRAVQSARAHRRQVPGPHQLEILKIFIPRDTMRIDATEDIE